MSSNRLYSTLTIKALPGGEGERLCSGIMSTPTPDHLSDVCDPLGAKLALPLPLLWQHRHDEVVGACHWAQATTKGIAFEAAIPQISEDGELKRLTDKAWHALTSSPQLVRGVSIGFTPIDSERIKGGQGVRYKSYTIHEASLVTIACNSECTVSAIKALDQQTLRFAAERKLLSRRDQEREVRSHKAPDPMQRVVESMNAHLFQGRLGPVRIKWHDTGPLGTCVDHTVSLHQDLLMDRVRLFKVLAHELCHAYTWGETDDDHGRRWRKVMWNCGLNPHTGAVMTCGPFDNWQRSLRQ
jgi:Escherichia/Staphylococcus phage prohead protease